MANIVRLILLGLLAYRLMQSLFSADGAVDVMSLTALGIAASLLIPSTVFFTYHLYSIIPFLFVVDRLSRNRFWYLTGFLVASYLLVQMAFFLPQILLRVSPTLISPDTGAFDWLGMLPVCYAFTLFCAAFFFCSPRARLAF